MNPLFTQQGFVRWRRWRQLVLGPLIGTFLVSYFAFFALFGQRSIGRLLKVQQEIAVTQKNVETIKAEYTELNQRVEHLRPQSIDLDLLDEQARRDLNLVNPDEEVVLLKPADDHRQ